MTNLFDARMQLLAYAGDNNAVEALRVRVSNVPGRDLVDIGGDLDLMRQREYLRAVLRVVADDLCEYTDGKDPLDKTLEAVRYTVNIERGRAAFQRARELEAAYTLLVAFVKEHRSP